MKAHKAPSGDLQDGLCELLVKNHALRVAASEDRECRSCLVHPAYYQHAFHPSQIAELHAEQAIVKLPIYGVSSRIQKEAFNSSRVPTLKRITWVSGVKVLTE